VRGRWGEMQLKRVVELSGLSAHCDFVEQSSQSDDEKTVRPDMIVTMPGGKQIVVDAKAPLDSFILDNNQSGDDEKKSSENLAQSLRRHLLTLSKKSYHKSVSSSPEFVVMFLPGELFFYKAMSADNNLIEFASKHSVVIATPMTLIALLKAVAFGFRQEAIAKNMEAVRQLSQRLIDRINKVGQHFERLGKNLKMATESYNQTLASLESRVLVTAKQLAELGDHKIDPGQEKNIAAASPVLVTPRSFAAISESE
jgi:DNA recombination protein RmuC